MASYGTQAESSTEGTSYRQKPQTNKLTNDDSTDPIFEGNVTQTTQDWKCHQPLDQINDDLLNIGFSNINGISGDTKRSLQENLQDIVATLQHHNITMLGMSEHHLAMNNPKTKQKIYELKRKIHKEIRTKFYLHSSQEITPNNKQLMGGTGIITLQPTIGCIDPNNTGGDTMGRWTYVTLQNNNGRPITVVSVYQVCQNPTNKLGGTAWHQQRQRSSRRTTTIDRTSSRSIHDGLDDLSTPTQNQESWHYSGRRLERIDTRESIQNTQTEYHNRTRRPMDTFLSRPRRVRNTWTGLQEDRLHSSQSITFTHHSIDQLQPSRYDTKQRPQNSNSPHLRV